MLYFTMHGIGESPKITGSSIDPKWHGSYYKDTHKKDPQFIETTTRTVGPVEDSHGGFYKLGGSFTGVPLSCL